MTAVYFSTAASLPLLQAAPAHHAIIISSMSGLMRPSRSHLAYNAARAATVHLAAMMSREFAPARVHVNSVAPGYFPSEMTAKESDARVKSKMPDQMVRKKGHEVPAGSAGRHDEMAMAILFLARW